MRGLQNKPRRVGTVALPIAGAPAIVDLKVIADYPPARLHRLGKGGGFFMALRVAAALVRQHADAPHALALLRARRERPDDGARACGNALAPSHSITSSVPASKACGTAKPSAFAVFRLMTN